MKKRKKKAVITAKLIEKVCAINKVIGLRQTLYAKSKHIGLLVGCSNTSVRRIIKTHIATNYSTDWKVVLKEYKGLSDEEQLKRMYKKEGEVMSTNVITIEKNIPIPRPLTNGRGGSYKYNFLSDLEIGDSFVINGNMPDYKPTCSSTLYAQAKERGLKVSIRTEEGPAKLPTRIRVWRVDETE